MPSTSTGMVRSSSGSASSAPSTAAASGAASSVKLAASTSSSTHLVEWCTLANASVDSSATWAGMVVCNPLISNSASARSMRLRALSRSGAQTTSLPIRLS